MVRYMGTGDVQFCVARSLC